MIVAAALQYAVVAFWELWRAPGVVVDRGWGAVRLLKLPVFAAARRCVDGVICGVWRAV